MSKPELAYLQHILEECKYIMSVVKDETKESEILKDETKKRALVRSLEVIGEATKKIPADVKIKWSAIAWRNMAGMRDRLIHDYMGINYAIVWDVVKNKIPEVKLQIEEVIKKEKNT